MTKSKLTDYTRLSPNSYFPRSQKVSKITVHHMAGNLTVEQCGAVFASPSRYASANYGIGTDGRIGCYVEEQNAAWTSSSAWNDNRAITIEVANSSTGGEWPVSDKAWRSLVKLCADVCKRYGIEPTYDGTTSASFTEHRMYAATACPGPYLHTRMSKLVKEVKEAMEDAPKQDPGKAVNNAGLWYRSHVQNVGWLAPVHDGQASGTVGYSKRMEAIKCTPPEGVSIDFALHVQNIGDVVYEGVERGRFDPVMGTEGKSLRLEGFRAVAHGLPEGKHLYYRAHVQGEGWQGWKRDGEYAGTRGKSLRMEAVQMKIQ